MIKYLKIYKEIIIVLMLMQLNVVLSNAQKSDYKDTFFVAGGNVEDLSKYINYYIDSTNCNTVEKVDSVRINGKFKHWAANTIFNIGINPYPLWFHLWLQNTNKKPKKYWWALYSSSDSIIVYRKKDTQNWQCTDTLSYRTPVHLRKMPTRFPVIEIATEPNETIEFLVKIRDLKTVESFYTDITTPEGSLLWENYFHWKIGLFVGSFLLLIVLNLILFILLKNSSFLCYAFYIFLAIIISLKEEYLLGVISSEFFFNTINKLHGFSLSIIGMGLQFYFLHFIFKNQANSNIKLLSYSKKINTLLSSYGIATLVYIFIYYTQISVNNQWYLNFWQISIAIIVLMAINTLWMIFLQSDTIKQKTINLIIGFLFTYFNIAGYYINYTGLVSIYPIIYPNYYYFSLSIEFIFLCILLILKYKKTFEKNYALLEEKMMLQESLHHIEFTTQQTERKNISRDLHDDLGATISTINLVVSNHYPNDTYLLNLLKRATNDIRLFTEKFSRLNVAEKSIQEILTEFIKELNELNEIIFNLIFIGTDKSFSNEIKSTLIRITIELSTNILKHSKATNATIQFIIDEEQILIITEDNGIGFNTNKDYNGIGLKNIMSRVKELKAEIHITSNIKGTTTIFTLPIQNVS